jgi:hypothetical protein
MDTNKLALRSALVLALALNITFAHADVTLEERITVEGLMKFANMHGKELTIVSGDRARTENDLQMDSKLMRMFAGSAMGPTAEIIRLDQEKQYSLNIKKKEYTELSFADMRANWQKMMDQAQQAQAQAQAQEQQQTQTPAPVDQSQCEWSEPRSEVKRTGEKATFAGYEGERVSITATQTCTDKKTGDVCDFALNLDEWVSPAFSEDAEVTNFYKSYAEKMGLTSQLTGDAAKRAETLFGGYKGLWSELGTKLQDMKGRPVKTTFGLSVGGPKCGSAKGSQQASNGAAPPSSDDMGQAAATAAGETAGQAAAEKAGESSLGGIAGKLGGKLGAALFKKKSEPAPAATPAAATATTTSTTAPDMVNMMQMSVELISMHKNPASAGAFEVPADFKKVSAQQ